MTELQIDAKFRAELKRLEKLLARGKISQTEYENQVYKLEIWADQQYSRAA